MVNIYKYLLSLLFCINLTVGIYADDINTICIVSSSGAKPYAQAAAGFKETTSKYAQVKFIEYSMNAGNQSQLVEEIKKNKPDLFMAAGSKALEFVRGEFPGQKAVYCMVLFAHGKTGGNVDGLELGIPEEYKLAEIVKLLPSVKALGVIYSGTSEIQFESLKAACEKSGINLYGEKAEEGADFQKALEKIRGNIDAYIMLADSVIYSPRSILSLFEESMEHKFAVIGLSSYYTKTGALLSFDHDYYIVGSDAAKLAVDRFFTGVKVVQGGSTEKKYGYTVNVLVAQRLGISLSPETVKNAVEVYGK